MRFQAIIISTQINFSKFLALLFEQKEKNNGLLLDHFVQVLNFKDDKKK